MYVKVISVPWKRKVERIIQKLNKILAENKTTDCLIYKDFIFHPGITLAMSETKLKIEKFASGFFIGTK